MRFDELNGLSDVELVHRAMSLERELTSHLFRHRMGRLENVSVLKRARRDIARAQTALTAREHAANLHRGALRAAHARTFVPAAAPAASGAGEGFLQSILDNKEAAE